MPQPERQLATREFTDQQIKQRIAAANKPGFGLEKATPAQLEMIYLLARHYDVDPAVDITLFRDRPWFTIDGRVRLMKRHPQYAGYKCRPLTQAEREAWGYKPDELVVECTIRTRDWGEISARGKLTAAEMRANTPTGSHPSEMAEKRAIARASRMAFGQDVPDEDDAGAVLEQRNDTERVAANAQRYAEIFEPNYEDLPPYVPIKDQAPAEDLYRCSDCAAPVLTQDNEPINESQASLIVERFGVLVCREHRPKSTQLAKR